MEIFDESYGISEWFDVLKWKCLPDMGPCHQFAASGEQQEFLQRYVVTPELQKFCGSILEKLKTKRIGQPVVMLKGDPGVGKTTMIYSLKSYLTNNPELCRMYSLYACHANNIDLDDWEHEVLYHAKQALKEHFFACKQGRLFNRICSDDEGSSDVDLRRQINRLKTCMAGDKYRNRFELTLIFVLDNVDTVTDSNRVLDAFELLNKVLEPAIIKKWFVVRPETIANYNSKQKKRLESFVSSQLTMPKTSLYEIAKKRVLNTTGDGSNKSNPFGKELCDEIILPFCKGNLRKGLSVLESLLLNTEPKGFKEKMTSEKVIQNYLRKNIVKTLYNEGLINNLHDIRYGVNALESPMAYDLLCLTKYSNQKNILLAMLYDATERRNKQTGYIVTGRDNKFTIYDHEFEKLIKSLKESELVSTDQANNVNLTSLGHAHINISTASYYASLSKEQGTSLRSDTYWEVASVDVSHAAIARNHSTSPII